MTEPWQQVNEEFACEHTETRMTFKTASNGVNSYRPQCVRCGQGLKVLKYVELSRSVMEAAVTFDEGLREQWWARRADRLAEVQRSAREAEDARWRAWYESYLASPQWAMRRDKVLKRAGHVCEGCLVRRAVLVHHVSYAHAGDELLYELAALCQQCHDKAHGKAGSPWGGGPPR